LIIIKASCAGHVGSIGSIDDTTCSSLPRAGGSEAKRVGPRTHPPPAPDQG